jgi:hypothetical protein
MGRNQVLGGSDLQIYVEIPVAAGMSGGEFGNRFMARNSAAMAEPMFNGLAREGGRRFGGTFSLGTETAVHLIGQRQMEIAHICH